ncbi:ABC transporter ATP-binding protein [Clostridium septicum]|uniref:ABC transporter ATP-binding protein n=1 Tax=Clostridium septicum TaxID=1504 RepID=A0A9N7PMX2_CLOSE|nr:ABC transporter ATP-binding protein [Clostridium septicum]AYE35732.1 ABC transporter ATP-binding protein [Clostridium septicum]MDU1314932.1 ABC transporter ATP-binding protein [Clostridium septicum]QAS61071.1 ABC transporter ATP-binding protein [Clostridium septicum]UEC19594.1 ABC transporter ATP-binding protein [Clostridium septicum]USS02347.1 ABC transporter ATP-binding protein [Clostridium septicum]
MLKVNNLSLKLGDKKILEDINFNVKKGTILGLVGPSGVGKTSLIKALVGIYEGNGGEILLNEEKIYDNSEVKKKIAYVPDEHNSFYLISIKEIVNYYKLIYDNFDENRFNKINSIFKIPINKRFFQLSKGMKVRVNLMLALSLNGELLVLDEPTSGLDPILKEKVLKLIMEEVIDKERVIIISSHNLIELERICDDIIMLDEGKIAYHNSLEGIKKNIKKIQVAFDMPVYKEDLNIDGIFSISQIGRVFTIVTDKYDNIFKEKLEEFNPLFIEEIDLSLEEVFIHKLEKEDDYEEIFK